jgi:hypothetical protein
VWHASVCVRPRCGGRKHDSKLLQTTAVTYFFSLLCFFFSFLFQRYRVLLCCPGWPGLDSSHPPASVSGVAGWQVCSISLGFVLLCGEHPYYCSFSSFLSCCSNIGWSIPTHFQIENSDLLLRTCSEIPSLNALLYFYATPSTFPVTLSYCIMVACRIISFPH